MGWGDFRRCYDKRPCFGRNDSGRCRLLNNVYLHDDCPFCKEHRDVTDGKVYPFNREYGLTYEKSRE